VRAAAELGREAGHRNDADAVGVLLAEERDRTRRDSFLEVANLGLERLIAQDFAVDEPLDFADLVVR
jgi:hypothetical protein